MKYKVFISYEYYDSIEVEANSYDEAQDMADEYVDNSGYSTCDHVDIEVERVKEEDE